ncbi:MAG: 3-ketoacyl-ACP reductase [Pseudomonadota bacterium]
MSGVALVTGGQRGIGLGIAQALAGAGFQVAITAERPPEEPEVAAALAAVKGMAYWQHDMRDVGAVSALLDAVEAELGPVTTLVSNAGIPAVVRGDMLALTPEAYDRVMEVNLKGGFFLAQEVARRMLGRDGPYRSILFVTSVSAEIASVERAEYCVSKAGASMMARLFAARLAEEGIGVFELRPGIIATDMTAGVRARYDALIADGLVPARRWGTPEDIGAAVLPLALGQMAYATGAVLPIDGGLSIQRL